MKKKILFCYVQFHHYRIPIWEELSKSYDVTVLHGSAPQEDEEFSFREISSPPLKFWRFRYQPKLLREVIFGKYDAVIFLFDLAWLSHFLGFLFCRKSARRITWGFWETKTDFANKTRVWISKRADGNVFYASGAARYFLSKGLDPQKIWIARNSVKVYPAERDTSATRRTILFLGSFNTRKENDVTIAAFNMACESIPPDIKLVLVGDGPAKTEAMNFADTLPNRGRIEFHPGTIDELTIRTFYAQALASISFGQAGLSVLQSFGHGVPFITKQNAISGGEIENIISGKTGLLCEPNQDALCNLLIDLCNNPEVAELLGNQALEYYKNYCSAEKMAAGFSESVEDIHLTTERIT